MKALSPRVAIKPPSGAHEDVRLRKVSPDWLVCKIYVAFSYFAFAILFISSPEPLSSRLQYKVHKRWNK
jgi:hypothetical protein